MKLLHRSLCDACCATELQLSRCYLAVGTLRPEEEKQQVQVEQVELRTEEEKQISQ